MAVTSNDLLRRFIADLEYARIVTPMAGIILSLSERSEHDVCNDINIIHGILEEDLAFQREYQELLRTL